MGFSLGARSSKAGQPSVPTRDHHIKSVCPPALIGVVTKDALARPSDARRVRSLTEGSLSGARKRFCITVETCKLFRGPSQCHQIQRGLLGIAGWRQAGSVPLCGSLRDVQRFDPKKFMSKSGKHFRPAKGLDWFGTAAPGQDRVRSNVSADALQGLELLPLIIMPGRIRNFQLHRFSVALRG